NIPGIAGVGEKTAAKLLKEYHTIENILANAGNIKGALGEKIRNGKENAIMSKKLATIMIDVPVEFHENNFCMKEWNREVLTDIFTELEFKTMAKRILGEEISISSLQQVTVEKPAQMDLFGNAVETKLPVKEIDEEGAQA